MRKRAPRIARVAFLGGDWYADTPMHENAYNFNYRQEIVCDEMDLDILKEKTDLVIDDATYKGWRLHTCNTLMTFAGDADHGPTFSNYLVFESKE